MCNALPIRALIEPLESRRLLAAAPATPFSPLDLPGAYQRPDGSIVVPNSSLAASPDAAPAAPADDTAGYFSTTPAPRGGTAPAVNWSAPAPDARFGGTPSAATADPAAPLPSAGVSSVIQLGSGGHSYGSTVEPSYNSQSPGCGGGAGFLAFSLTGCGPGAPGSYSVTVNYSLPAESGDPFSTVYAKPGEDYVGPLAAGRSVSVPYQSTVLVPYYARADNLVEGGEYVHATILAGVGYTGAGNGGEATITDNPPVVSIDGGAGLSESASTGNVGHDAVYTLTRRGGDLGAVLDVNFEADVGTATAGSDYKIHYQGRELDSLPTTVRFEANSSSVVFSDSVINDQELEEHESILRTLKKSSNGTYLIQAGQSAAPSGINDNETVEVRFLSVGDFSDSDTVHDYDGLNSHLSWRFDAISFVILGKGYINLRAEANGSQNQPFGFGPDHTDHAQIPSNPDDDPYFVTIEARVAWSTDPDTGKKTYQLVIDEPSHDVRKPGGNVSVGMDARVSYVNTTRATVQAVFAAQYDKGGAGITAVNVGPGGIQWSQGSGQTRDSRTSGVWNVVATIVQN